MPGGYQKLPRVTPRALKIEAPGSQNPRNFEMAVETWVRDHIGRARGGLLGPRLVIRVAIWAAGGPRGGPPRRDFESKINFSDKKIGLGAGIEKTWKIESILSEK